MKSEDILNANYNVVQSQCTSMENPLNTSEWGFQSVAAQLGRV